MSAKQLVKISNIIGLVSIILLIYWVFTFVTIQVFGLKVFRQNMTETFYLSILGILALMVGALIINIMFNLSRIAQKHNNDEVIAKSNKIRYIILILLFPIIVGLLFYGDYYTSYKREKLLIKSAKSIIESNIQKSEKLLNYSFTEDYIIETSSILNLFTKTDENFPNLAVIVKDTIENSSVFLIINSYDNFDIEDTILPNKKNFIQPTTEIERDYLYKVFSGKTTEPRYSFHDGDYELYYPFVKGNKKIVLYFSDYQRYGK